MVANIRPKSSRQKKSRDTNLASEFYVLSALYRLGADANLTLTNRKGVDIVIVRAPGEAVTIDVKAVANKTDWLAGSGDRTAQKNHFVVLLSFEAKFADLTTVPSTWVLPHAAFLELVRTAKPPSQMRYVSRKEVLETCQKWRDAWVQVCEV